MNEILSFLKYAVTLIPLLAPTSAGRERRNRRRRYKAITKLRDQRDKGEITQERYLEDYKTIMETYPG